MIITNDTATDIWQQKLLLKITQTEAMTVSLLTNIINTAAAAATAAHLLRVNTLCELFLQ